MNRLLGISLAVNVALGVWVWKLHEPSARKGAGIAVGAASPEKIPGPAPFHWSQIEAEDYSVFIGNLRRIGCPPQTIRDIVAADLRGVFDARRERLKTNSLPAAARAEALRAIDTDEANALRQLFAPSRQSASRIAAESMPKVAAATVAAPADATAPAISAEVANAASKPLPPDPAPTSQATRTPQHGEPTREELIAFFSNPATAESPAKLVFESVSPTEAEMREMYHLSTKFDAEFGGGNPNPADRSWDARRRRAIQDMEDQLRSMIGYERFNQYIRDSVIRAQGSR